MMMVPGACRMEQDGFRICLFSVYPDVVHGNAGVMGLNVYAMFAGIRIRTSRGAFF